MCPALGSDDLTLNQLGTSIQILLKPNAGHGTRFFYKITTLQDTHNSIIKKIYKNKLCTEYSNTALVGHQDQPQDTLGELVAQVHQKKKY